MWELISDSRTQPELLEDRIVILLSVLLEEQREFIGTPTELSQKIDPDGQEGITPKKVARLILQSVDTLRKNRISAVIRRSNGRRIIQLSSADSDDTAVPREIGTIDPVGQTVGGGKPDPAEGDSSLSGGQASRPAIRRPQFRGTAPAPNP